MMPPDLPVEAIVRRQTDGTWVCEVPGCGWSSSARSNNSGHAHVMAAHPGMEPHTLTKRLRGNKRLQGEEAKAHRRQQWREASARSRAKKRQLHQMAQQRPLRLPG